VAFLNMGYPFQICTNHALHVSAMDSRLHKPFDIKPLPQQYMREVLIANRKLQSVSWNEMPFSD